IVVLFNEKDRKIQDNFFNSVFFRRFAMMIDLRKLFCCLCLLLSTHGPLYAALDIEIFGGGATRIPIAIMPFAAESNLPQRITTVVSADLERSGLFKLVDTFGLVPH